MFKIRRTIASKIYPASIPGFECQSKVLARFRILQFHDVLCKTVLDELRPWP